MSKFRILWIDDQKTKCKKDVRAVKRIIESFGYEPDIQVMDDISADSLNNEHGSLNKAIRARDVDLFVIDYNLKNNLFGGDVVEEIRQNNDIYTDIIFYSSSTDSLIDAVKNSFDSESSMKYFDGVYIAPLGDEFTEKVRSVILKIIKSWYNVHSIRGILLSKASKFEQMIANIIYANYRPCLDKLKENLAIKGTNVCESVSNKWSSVKKQSDPIPQILKDPINFNWKVKEKLLQTLCDENVVSISTWNEIKYIFSLRNEFAHNPIHLKDGALVLTRTAGETIYTEDDVEIIRDYLTKVENDLHKVLNLKDSSTVLPEHLEELGEEVSLV